jgi:hypothetical protein
MNPSRSGLSSIAKIAVVIVIALLVLSGIYLAPSLLSNKKSSPTVVGSSGGTHTFGLLQLFKYFPQLQLKSAVYNPSGSGGTMQEEVFSYTVLGNASFQGTHNLKVEFSTTGGGDNIVGWFNSSGVVDELDIIGGTNYTGPAAPLLAQTYVDTFSLITTATNNATLFSLLNETSQNTTRIGSAQLAVSTYHLTTKDRTYDSITAEYATIPGTFQKLMVYLDERLTDGVENTFQVTSLKSSSSS